MNIQLIQHPRLKKLAKYLFIICTFFWLTSCGWKFQVLSSQLPIEKVFVSGIENGVGRELLNRLRRTDVQIVTSGIEAQVIVNLEVNNEKVVVGFSGAGRPRELELRTSVRLEITDQEDRPIQPLDELKIVRSVNFSDTDVLAAQSHEAFHRQDIDKQLAMRIIERLQRVTPVHYAN
jgi:outer membrane lipopolysaccharide assembly protein LptE/RlpB